MSSEVKLILGRRGPSFVNGARIASTIREGNDGLGSRPDMVIVGSGSPLTLISPSTDCRVRLFVGLMLKGGAPSEVVDKRRSEDEVGVR